MGRIIISQHNDLQRNLSALSKCKVVLEVLIQSHSIFQKSTGVDLLNFTDKKSFDQIVGESNIIPNSDKSGFAFRIDFNNDVIEMISITIERLYELHEGKLGSLPVEKEIFLESVSVNQDFIEELVQAKRELDDFVRSSPDHFKQFVSIVKGNVLVSPNAEIELTESLTVYASENQSRAFAEVNELLSKLKDVEERFKCPGMLTSMINFDPQHLTQIKN